MTKPEYVQLTFSDLNLPAQQGLDDVVNHPKHYTQGNIETIEYMESALTAEEFCGGCKMNVLKYVSREKHKNGIEDLKKARWYLDRLIAYLEKLSETR
jgi:Protein of unknwon function (DUF3310)